MISYNLGKYWWFVWLWVWFRT